MKAYIYLITRNDDRQYVGITSNMKKRISEHKRTDRFSIGIKRIEILKECETYEEAEILEESYIAKYNTFHDGLNESINGKGNHLAPNFTTKGLKFSEETKEKMSRNHWSKTGKYRPVGIAHTDETKSIWSKKRKGKSWAPRKISYEEALKIKKSYDNDEIFFDETFIRNFVKPAHKNLVGSVNLEELKTPNGKNLSKIKLYSEYYAEKHKVTAAAIRRICEGKICHDAK